MKTFVKPLTVVAIATVLSVGSTKFDLSSLSLSSSTNTKSNTTVSPTGADEPIIAKKESKKIQYTIINKSISGSTKMNATENLLDIIRFVAPENNAILVETPAETETVASLVKFVLPADDNNTSIAEPVETNYINDLVKFKVPEVSNDEIIEPKANNEFSELVKFKVPASEKTSIEEPVQLEDLVKFKVQISDYVNLEQPTVCDNQLTRASK
ncbi:hypothetical protein [Solitalea koreensis]|uniref:Uncharacterized protein n=1 Tax=Solitalea koreensis TaxID=543615 RepID=A0A521E5J9_9SPHI|nr:hypothetical protein [Solitalea koreensis]SMO79223.1 hypothetical protein SAMN06265350_11155 [Solitalea koreensis]